MPSSQPSSLPTSQPTIQKEYSVTGGEYAAIIIGTIILGGICIHLLVGKRIKATPKKKDEQKDENACGMFQFCTNFFEAAGERVWACMQVVFTATDVTTDILFIHQLWREMHCLPGSGCQDAQQRYQINHQHVIAAIIFVIVPVLANAGVIIYFGVFKIHWWEYSTNLKTVSDKTFSKWSEFWCGCTWRPCSENNQKNETSDVGCFCISLRAGCWWLALITFVLNVLKLGFLAFLRYVVMLMCDVGLLISCLTNSELAAIYYCGEKNAVDMFILGIVCEDLPQLVIQISYAYQTRKFSGVQIASMAFTIWKIPFGLIKAMQQHYQIEYCVEEVPKFNIFPYDKLLEILNCGNFVKKSDNSNQAKIRGHRESEIAPTDVQLSTYLQLPLNDEMDIIASAQNKANLHTFEKAVVLSRQTKML